jgi:hypothetical protein
VKIDGGLGLLVTGAAAIAVIGCGRDLTAGNGRCGPTPQLLVAASAFPVDAAVGITQSSVTGMVLDGSDLYFAVNPTLTPGTPATATGPGAVMHVSTYGGSPTQLAGGYAFRVPTLTSTSVILGEMGVYPSTSEVDIATVPRSGGAQTTLATFDSVLFLSPVSDGTSVFFSDGTGVESVPFAPPSPPVTPTRLSPAYPSNIGVFGQSLLMLMPDGEVLSLPIGAADAGTISMLGVGATSVPQTLIPCGNDACWLGGDGEIDQMDPATGAVTLAITLTGSVAQPLGLVYDGATFFVVGQNNASATSAAIVSVPGSGGAQNVVAILPAPGPIAVDDACVYFSTSTGIFSLQKGSQSVVVP